MTVQHTAARITIGAVLVASMFFANAGTVHAQEAIKNFKAGVATTVKDTGVKTSASAEDIPRLAGSLIGQVLSLIGVVFFLITLIAGFFWMFALGNEDRARKAKDTIVAAVGGLIVVIGSYAITDFVLVTVQKQKADPVTGLTDGAGTCGEGVYAEAICTDASRCAPQGAYETATCATSGQVCCYDIDLLDL